MQNLLIKGWDLPIKNHYYEPQFDFREAKKCPSEARVLPGIHWSLSDQLRLLLEFNYGKELVGISMAKTDELSFYFNNGAFESGDAEYWYQLIRSKRPKRIFEIGSGNSTLMALRAIQQNVKEDASYRCHHVCIEPYEMPWLERTGVTVLRERVENVNISFFSKLEENDILFIDSLHMIRPDGDVLFEYLQLLPTLNKGVIVHVHDIFSPNNYPEMWLKDEVLFWNEQYLLEAFLTNNSAWKIIGSLNYLHHNHYDEFERVCPFLTRDREPGSFYMQKIQ